jgi:hypothetical protein
MAMYSKKVSVVCKGEVLVQVFRDSKEIYSHTLEWHHLPTLTALFTPIESGECLKKLLLIGNSTANKIIEEAKKLEVL